MKFFLEKLSSRKALYYILIGGALLRLLFLFFGGKIYYGTANFFIQGDTDSWFNSFVNFWNHGTYQSYGGIESSKFFRPPGYSFLFGFFYLLSFENYAVAWKLLVGAQLIMDIASIYIISRIAAYAVRDSNHDKKIVYSNMAALLFACYPFAIVWAPVLYAETSSVFFTLLSILFALKETSPKNIFFAGLFGGIATLLRLQSAFCVLFAGIVVFNAARDRKQRFRYITYFSFAVLVSYGLWPMRNIFFQHRVLFSQDLNIGRNWSRDYMSFMDYIFSIKTDYNSVYHEIIENKEVHWPAAAYLEPGDSALLDSAVNLCRTCGTGFSYWKFFSGLQQEVVAPGQSCDTAIDKIFTTLSARQRTKNPVSYWLKVPLGNLSKCLFKISLYGNKSRVVKISGSSLFILRSFFVCLGFLGLYTGFRKKFFTEKFLLFSAGYIVTWYIFLSFFYRNIEMRYLLHCDILLLIPSAYLLVLFFRRNQPAT